MPAQGAKDRTRRGDSPNLCEGDNRRQGVCSRPASELGNSAASPAMSSRPERRAGRRRHATTCLRPPRFSPYDACLFLEYGA